MNDAVKIVGGNGKRNKNDFYPTPPEVTVALLQTGLIHPNACVWEPACGKGDMVRVFWGNGYNCIGTDIETGTDFLTANMPDEVDCIVTNPPFSLAEKFIRRAAEHKVPFAFLLKSQYWHSKKRKQLFEQIRPTHVLPLTWRPDFTGQGGSLLDMMWCVWLNDRFLRSNMTIYEPLERPKLQI